MHRTSKYRFVLYSYILNLCPYVPVFPLKKKPVAMFLLIATDMLLFRTALKMQNKKEANSKENL